MRTQPRTLGKQRGQESRVAQIHPRAQSSPALRLSTSVFLRCLSWGRPNHQEAESAFRVSESGQPVHRKRLAICESATTRLHRHVSPKGHYWENQKRKSRRPTSYPCEGHMKSLGKPGPGVSHVPLVPSRCPRRSERPAHGALPPPFLLQAGQPTWWARGPRRQSHRHVTMQRKGLTGRASGERKQRCRDNGRCLPRVTV